MRLVKKFEPDERTLVVSRLFDELMIRNIYPLPFSRVELHLRDYAVTTFDSDSAIICLDYNNPLILEKDIRGIRVILEHELFRLVMRINYPRIIEDVFVGREIIKRGKGEELFYMYYNIMMKSRHDNSMLDFLHTNVPWTIFKGLDDYNSDFLKALAGKLCASRPEGRKFLAVLSKLSETNVKGALKEYHSLVR